MIAACLRSATIVGATLLAAAWGAAPAQAAGFQEKVIHTFAGGADGQYPNSVLTVSPLGVLYGTTPGGGTPCGTGYGCGVVFQLTASQNGTWQETILYAFQGGNDGAFPNNSKLLLASDGSLYGVTASGGTSGSGTVFHLAPPGNSSPNWTETIIHDFTGGTDGGNPETDLVADSSGVLYGTTTAGGGTGCGGAGCGTVFSLTPPAKPNAAWKLKTLHKFTGAGDGAVPISGVVFNPQGQLFGTTTQGGSTACGGAGCGVVFELAPPVAGSTAPWSATVLHRFAAKANGETAFGSLYLDGSGNLFGATEFGGTYGCGTAPLTGCGTSFMLSPPAAGQSGYVFMRLHNNSGGRDGSFPNGNLVAGAGGILVGTTYGGGYDCPVCAGTAFALVPPSPGGTWSQVAKYLFKGPPKDGTGPTVGLAADTSGNFYGTTVAGGSTGLGIVFELTP